MSGFALTPVYSGSLLGGLPTAFRDLSGTVRPANAALRELTRALREAAGRAGRFTGEVRNAAGTVSRFRTGVVSADGSVTKLGRSQAQRGVKSFGDKAGKARTAAGKISTGAGGVLALLLPLLPVADLVTGLMSTFGIVMTVASVAMTAVNVAMRANPLGFLLGILVPVAAYLIEFAMSSEAGQRIMKQVFDQALKGFQAVWAFLGPLAKAIGTVIGTYFKGYLALITGVVRGIGAVVGGASKIGAAVSAPSNALRGIASNTLGRVRDAVRPVVSWLTEKAPGFFRTAKDALSRSLSGIGDLVEGGLSTVLGVVKGPINGLIAFANWIIDGLNDLSFDFLGKKFGVDLDKIPMLADGGVVFPGDTDAYRIDPLSALENRRVPALTEPPRRPHRIRDFHEDPGAGPRSTAEDLLFLAIAHH
ncbi:tape-measure protein [Streptomyces sp. NPDC088752]|uniref:tape-measure protein n=1 Tax=Streptomyces sp. NPDC088752 TaxID=3154963 RepID=UPI0034479D62